MLEEIYHTEALKNRVDGRYLMRQEIRLRNRIKKNVFDKQLKYIINGLNKFWVFRESFREDVQSDLIEKVNELVDNLIGQDTLADLLETQMQLLLNRGSKRIINELNLGTFGIKFNVENKLAKKHLKDKKDFELSNALGNITGTTKDRLRTILVRAVEFGTSYTELSKDIELLSKTGIFSKSRGQLIATRELGHAYEEGNRIPLVEFSKENPDRPVVKFWRTVGDDRVTKTHTANQSDEWIAFNKIFSGTSDLRAPGSDNPRCRCFTEYKISAPKN